MSARDIFHEAAKHALEKDGWEITDDPLRLRWGGATVQIDLGATRLIGAKRGEETIAVEIKSFQGASALSEFHTALGQYLNYLTILEGVEPDRHLFLAVTADVYAEFLSQQRLTQKQIERYEIKIIVFDPLEEVIVQWLT